MPSAKSKVSKPTANKTTTPPSEVRRAANYISGYTNGDIESYLERNAKYHCPTDEQGERLDAVTEAFTNLAFVIMTNCPKNSADSTHALIRLKEVKMYAASAIVND